MSTFLSPNTMYKLSNLFNEKKWEIDEDNDVRSSIYRRYCEMLKLLEEKEQQFFIELSYRFEHVDFSDYLEFFLMSFHKLDESKLKAVDKIIFTPLTKPYIISNSKSLKVVRPKTKSAQFLFYYLTMHDLRWIDYSKKFVFLESIKEVKKEFDDNNSLLVLIDDFVGTGGTAVNCIEDITAEIREVKKISNNNICLISIAALSEGVTKIYNKLNVNVYSNIVRSKGISNYYTNAEISFKIELMENIEKKLKCPKEFSLGFGKSEALISFMNKTPNNTFPAYWHEDEKKIAPFPRYKNYK